MLHRENIFREKVKVAKEMKTKSQLKFESINLRNYLLNKCADEIITLEQIRKHYKLNNNIHLRARDLVYHMKKNNELISIGLGKYKVQGDKNEN